MSNARSRNRNLGVEVYEAITSYSPDRLEYLINQEENPTAVTMAPLSECIRKWDVGNKKPQAT